jgi:hypothetical protein
MPKPTSYRKLPVTVEALEWTGVNVEQLIEWTRGKFDVVAPRDQTSDPDITGEVFDDLHSTWVGVKTGQHIVRGVRGEFYPIDPGVLAETYEPVED